MRGTVRVFICAAEVGDGSPWMASGRFLSCLARDACGPATTIGEIASSSMFPAIQSARPQTPVRPHQSQSRSPSGRDVIAAKTANSRCQPFRTELSNRKSLGDDFWIPSDRKRTRQVCLGSTMVKQVNFFPEEGGPRQPNGSVELGAETLPTPRQCPPRWTSPKDSAPPSRGRGVAPRKKLSSGRRVRLPTSISAVDGPPQDAQQQDFASWLRGRGAQLTAALGGFSHRSGRRVDGPRFVQICCGLQESFTDANATHNSCHNPRAERRSLRVTCVSRPPVDCRARAGRFLKGARKREGGSDAFGGVSSRIPTGPKSCFHWAKVSST